MSYEFSVPSLTPRYQPGRLERLAAGATFGAAALFGGEHAAQAQEYHRDAAVHAASDRRSEAGHARREGGVSWTAEDQRLMTQLLEQQERLGFRREAQAVSERTMERAHDLANRYVRHEMEAFEQSHPHGIGQGLLEQASSMNQEHGGRATADHHYSGLSHHTSPARVRAWVDRLHGAPIDVSHLVVSYEHTQSEAERDSVALSRAHAHHDASLNEEARQFDYLRVTPGSIGHERLPMRRDRVSYQARTLEDAFGATLQLLAARFTSQGAHTQVDFTLGSGLQQLRIEDLSSTNTIQGLRIDEIDRDEQGMWHVTLSGEGQQ